MIKNGTDQVGRQNFASVNLSYLSDFRTKARFEICEKDRRSGFHGLEVTSLDLGADVFRLYTSACCPDLWPISCGADFAIISPGGLSSGWLELKPHDTGPTTG